MAQVKRDETTADVQEWLARNIYAKSDLPSYNLKAAETALNHLSRGKNSSDAQTVLQLIERDIALWRVILAQNITDENRRDYYLYGPARFGFLNIPKITASSRLSPIPGTPRTHRSRSAYSQ